MIKVYDFFTSLSETVHFHVNLAYGPKEQSIFLVDQKLRKDLYNKLMLSKLPISKYVIPDLQDKKEVKNINSDNILWNLDHWSKIRNIDYMKLNPNILDIVSKKYVL